MDCSFRQQLCSQAGQAGAEPGATGALPGKAVLSHREEAVNRKTSGWKVIITFGAAMCTQQAKAPECVRLLVFWMPSHKPEGPGAQFLLLEFPISLMFFI